MKAGLVILLVSGISLTRSFGENAATQAKPAATETEAANAADSSTSVLSEARFSSLLNSAATINKSDVSVQKRSRFGGPLLSAFRAFDLTEVPKRVMQLINPFAPVEQSDRIDKTTYLSARAWSTTVGWNPGGSAFADARTHEANLTLVRIGR